MKRFTITTILITSVIALSVSTVGWFYLNRYLAKTDLLALGVTYSESSFVKTVCDDNTVASLLFIKSGMDINTKAEGNLTALHCAAQHGNVDLIKAFIDKKADINAKTDNPHSQLLTPLHMAIKSRKMDSVNLLLNAGADINANSPQGTPLFIAATYGNNDQVITLINHGANVKITDKWGNTALHAAVNNSNPEVIIDTLISNGVDVNAKGKDKQTALHLAVTARNNVLVEKLIEHSADVNAVSDSGTPLLIAYNNNIITETLLANKADPNITDNNGTTPLIYSAKSKDNTVSNMLLEAGANVNVTTKSNDTPLIVAVKHCNLDLTGTLIKKGANTRVCCNKSTPLHTSVVYNKNCNSLQMITLLLIAGSDINARDEAGRTPLIEARYAPLAIVEKLVSSGANINEKDNLGVSVLKWYQHAKQSPALDFLTSKIATSTATTQPTVKEQPTIQELLTTREESMRQVQEIRGKYKHQSETYKKQ